MPHFFVPPKNQKGLFFFFDKSESRHISRALRKKSGELVSIFDGQGKVQKAKILDVSNPSKVTGEIVGNPPDSGSVSKPRRILKIYPALIKGPRFEWMIEKLTEMGVSSIHPIVTERTIVRIRSEQSESKLKRWKKIVLAASKQSGRSDIPAVFEPVSFDQAVASDRALSEEVPHPWCYKGAAQNKETLGLMLWEGEENLTLSQALSKFAETRPKTEGFSIRLFVGPEGGLAIPEAEKAKANGILTVGLGQNILRAETAAIASAAVVLYQND